MITVDQAKQIIAQHTSPLEPVELHLSEACGHILASSIYATVDIPAFRQSSMDGYAFQYIPDITKFLLTGEIAAGTHTPLQINTGECSRIFTGAPLPEGADTVVMQENISRIENEIILGDTRISKGMHVREKGSEIKAGALAVSKGTYLGPAAIGYLAGIGMSKVNVIPMPSVSIILTGNELQQPGNELAFGQVYESNSYSLSAALKNEGILQIKLFWVHDHLQSLSATLETALEQSDIVLLTGGVSVGDYDFVLAATQQCDITQQFHKVKQKPGKPLFFGTKDRKLIFGLPGNPSSVLSCYYNYVLPAVKAISGKENNVKEIEAEMEIAYQKPAGLTHFLKGIYKDGKALPLGAQDSYRLSTFAQANCLIRLNENQTDVAKGERVTIVLLPD